MSHGVLPWCVTMVCNHDVLPWLPLLPDDWGGVVGPYLTNYAHVPCIPQPDYTTVKPC